MPIPRKYHPLRHVRGTANNPSKIYLVRGGRIIIKSPVSEVEIERTGAAGALGIGPAVLESGPDWMAMERYQTTLREYKQKFKSLYEAYATRLSNQIWTLSEKMNRKLGFINRDMHAGNVVFYLDTKNRPVLRSVRFIDFSSIFTNSQLDRPTISRNFRVPASTACALCSGKTKNGTLCGRKASCKKNCRYVCWQHAANYTKGIGCR